MSLEDFKDAHWDERRMLRARTRVRTELLTNPPATSAPSAPPPGPLSEVDALRAELARRKQQLTDAQVQVAMSERLASIGVLAAGVGHELNNPLAYISANLSFLRSELARQLTGAHGPGAETPPASAAELLEAVDDAMQGAARVRTILGDLKRWGSEGAESLRPVDVHGVLDAALKIATHSQRPPCLVRHGYAASHRAAAHEGRLGQVLVNLITNALQSFPAGRDIAENELRLTTSVVGRNVIVEVIDNGCGMDEATLARAFDPFFTTRTGGGGTGLGLPICRDLVRKMNGEITVHSAPLQGTRVRVTLPIASSR